MARLIVCEVCGKHFSSEAASCPNCGDPMTEEKKEKAIKTAEIKAKKKAKEDELSKKAELAWNHYERLSKSHGACPICGKYQEETICPSGHIVWSWKCGHDVSKYFYDMYGV